MKKIMQFSVFLLFCFFALACNKSDEDLCELGPALPIFCIQVYDPVCGCNEITYGNECEARAAGVPSFSPGKCL